MTHPVGLVTYANAVHAWVLDLPGAIAGAPDIDALRDVLPRTIAEYEAWLRAHGEPLEMSSAWEIAETIDGEALAATGGEFCFDYDRAPIDSGELEHLIRYMTWSRDDLHAAIDSLPDALLDWAPPASSIASADAWAPEVRTIREIMTHVLQLEVYYRDALRDGPAKGIFEPAGDPAAERARTLDLLRSLDDAARSRVYLPVRPGRSTPEEWTVRKLIRRIISHERVHAAEARQRLTWVLLGVPCLRDHS
jgi:hypothetical protein